jgi:hypothetical protein
MRSHTYRLVVDVLRRHWPIYAFAGVLAFLSAWSYLATVVDVFAWSMVMAYCLGVMPFVALVAREVTQLPVSRRDLWRAGWILAVIAPATVTSAIKVAAFWTGGGPLLTGSQILLSGAYDLLYCGLMMCAFRMLPFSFATLKGPVDTMLHVIAAVAFIGGVGWPFLIRHLFVVDPASLGPLAIAIMAAAASSSILAYFHRPRPAARPSRARVAPRGSRASRWPSIGDHLTGVVFLMWKEGRITLAMYAITVILILVYWRMVETSLGLGDFLNAGVLLPFAGIPVLYRGFPGILMLLMSGASDTTLIGDMRRIRALPMSASGVATLLTGLGVLAALLLWLVLLTLHLFAVGAAPATWRPDLFMVVAGSLALTRAVRLTLPAPMLAKAIVGGMTVVPAIIVFPIAYNPRPPSTSLVIISLGVLALVLSFLINRWGIRNSSRLYKRQPVWPPFANTQHPS